MTLVRQTCEPIPSHIVPKVAREYEIDARKFSPWSHTVAHIYGQLTHAVGLNDICDGLDLNSSELRAIRGATAPRRNTFPHANRIRDPRMAEDLYWRMIEYLPTVAPSFGARKIRSGYLRRFNTAIHAVDSTTIQLVANSMDWAKHRRRKAAAKCHMNLDLHTKTGSMSYVTPEVFSADVAIKETLETIVGLPCHLHGLYVEAKQPGWRAVSDKLTRCLGQGTRVLVLRAVHSRRSPSRPGLYWHK